MINKSHSSLCPSSVRKSGHCSKARKQALVAAVCWNVDLPRFASSTPLLSSMKAKIAYRPADDLLVFPEGVRLPQTLEHVMPGWS